ncbi:MAG: 2,3-bisphosphoglycerate-independent phosphoglycerate mutase [Pseudomonadota bacterium]
MQQSPALRAPVVLIILDGFGVNPSKAHNAIALAHTPRFDDYFAHHAHCVIEASGRACGLPDGQMGNSEVGHITLGSGCIVRQDLVIIDDAIADGSFFKNPALLSALQRTGDQPRRVHLWGLVSDGGVHSHLNHLLALIQMAHQQGVQPIVHMVTDGRDTPPRCASDYLPPLEAALGAADGRIATLSGRYYAMDRDHRWERIEQAFRALVLAEGRRVGSSCGAIDAAYRHGEDDEFILPTVIGEGCPMLPDDAVIAFNFRKDRPRQMVRALCQADFTAFHRGSFQPLSPVCMTQYEEALGLPYAFTQERPAITLGQYLSDLNLAQFHCAETEKFAHITYFFNGGRHEPYPGEDRVIVPSPKVATYDLQPEMSAPAVADEVIRAIISGRYSFIVVNFANGDMVGHSAMREAVIQAVEVLDTQAGRVLDAAVAQGYSALLTSDHGNCDEMVDPATGEPHTQHTHYPVPCLVVDRQAWHLTMGGGIQQIAATVLDLMGLPRPAAMRGRSLLLGTAQALSPYA